MLRVFLLLAASILVRQSVIFAGQHWIKTYSHTITILTLPIITYTITSVIAGNIALSLGLVGALSIVRFRNPVKSPFELVIYFLMITAGIAVSVNPIWLIILIAAFVILTVASEAANRIMRRRTGASLFPASFTEGNALSTLTILNADPFPELNGRPDLIGYVADEEGYEYRIVSASRADLMALAASFEGRANSIDFRAP
ncbi:MAG: DUF4956 domain-containing protein [Pseudomonadota bacterium]